LKMSRFGMTPLKIRFARMSLSNARGDAFHRRLFGKSF
jgi:hypothetical protein